MDKKKGSMFVDVSRYSISATGDEMLDTDGEYVKFVDHEAALASLASQSQAAQPTDSRLSEAALNLRALAKSGRELRNTGEYYKLCLHDIVELGRVAQILDNAAAAHLAGQSQATKAQAEPVAKFWYDANAQVKYQHLIDDAYQADILVSTHKLGNYTAPLYAAPVAKEAQPRPTDDQLWDATLRDRDTYHEWADKLAEAIAKHFGAEIGEHSNMNCPWSEALEVIEGAEPVASVAKEAPPHYRKATTELSLPELVEQFAAVAKLGGDYTLSAGVCAMLHAAMTTPPVAKEAEKVPAWLAKMVSAMSADEQEEFARFFHELSNKAGEQAHVMPPTRGTDSQRNAGTVVLSGDDIEHAWDRMPGQPGGFLKSFGYLQFAREIEAEVTRRFRDGSK